jgi:hypothetical protein
MYYIRSFVTKKAIIAHPINKVKSSFLNQLGDICYYHRMCQKRRPAPGHEGDTSIRPLAFRGTMTPSRFEQAASLAPVIPRTRVGLTAWNVPRDPGRAFFFGTFCGSSIYRQVGLKNYFLLHLWDE